MDPIPLTHFVDFILTTGPSRVANVRAFQRPGGELHLNFLSSFMVVMLPCFQSRWCRGPC